MHYHHITNLSSDRDLLGSGDQRQVWYQNVLQGCFDYYTTATRDGKERCMHVERERIAMNLRQPQSMKNYTQNGFIKMRAPDNVWKLIQDFWEMNKNNYVEEEWPVGYVSTNYKVGAGT